MIQPLTNEHLLFEIFSYFDDPRDLLRCSKVNKLWNRIAENSKLWESLCYKINLHNRFFDSWKSTYAKMGAFSNGGWVCQKEVSREGTICVNDKLIFYVSTVYHNNLCAYLKSDCTVVVEDWVLDQQVGTFELPEDAFNDTEEGLIVENFGSCILRLDSQSIKLNIPVWCINTYKKYTWNFEKKDVSKTVGNGETLMYLAGKQISKLTFNDKDPGHVRNFHFCKDNRFVLIFHSPNYLFGIWDEENKKIVHLQSKDSSSDNFLYSYITGDALVILDGNLISSWRLDTYEKIGRFPLSTVIDRWDVSADFSNHLFYFLKGRSLLQICDSEGNLLRKFEYSMIDPNIASIKKITTCMGKMCIEYATHGNAGSTKIATGEFKHFPKKG